MRLSGYQIMFFQAAAFWFHIQAIPIGWHLSSRATPSDPHPSSSLFHVDRATTAGLLWSSIGLAVLTALFQGLVSALAYMTETSNYWTFRFRLAKIEHWWWTAVSGLLLISLALITLSFASGNSNETISILVLSSTTFLTIVRYMLPSWSSRHFIQNRWLAWAGQSRTGIPLEKRAYCGSKSDWRIISERVLIGEGKSVASDYYGWHLLPLKGITKDPTDILKAVNSTALPRGEGRVAYVYSDGNTMSQNVSLIWGEPQGFQPRVSRAISAVTISLLKSQPFTDDGYGGESFCLGMGILGRNKGLNPRNLVFNMKPPISTELEGKSAWEPRPSKALRSYYQKFLNEQYSYLGTSFVNAAVELCLILADADTPAIGAWLTAQCEHQSIEINQALQDSQATPQELEAHYQSSYVSMIISLNNMIDSQIGRRGHEHVQAKRPDILCLGLLLKANGIPKPTWWNKPLFDGYRNGERTHLDAQWYQAAAKLLGLDVYPSGFENGLWDGTPTPPAAPLESVPGLPPSGAAGPSQIKPPANADDLDNLVIESGPGGIALGPVTSARPQVLSRPTLQLASTNERASETTLYSSLKTKSSYNGND